MEAIKDNADNLVKETKYQEAVDIYTMLLQSNELEKQNNQILFNIGFCKYNLKDYFNAWSIFEELL